MAVAGIGAAASLLQSFAAIFNACKDNEEKDAIPPSVMAGLLAKVADYAKSNESSWTAGKSSVLSSPVVASNPALQTSLRSAMSLVDTLAAERSLGVDALVGALNSLTANADNKESMMKNLGNSVSFVSERMGDLDPAGQDMVGALRAIGASAFADPIGTAARVGAGDDADVRKFDAQVKDGTLKPGARSEAHARDTSTAASTDVRAGASARASSSSHNLAN